MDNLVIHVNNLLVVAVCKLFIQQILEILCFIFCLIIRTSEVKGLNDQLIVHINLILYSYKSKLIVQSGVRSFKITIIEKLLLLLLLLFANLNFWD